jgi:hypothetical protein
MGEFVLNKLKESIGNKLKLIFSVFNTQHSIVSTFQHCVWIAQINFYRNINDFPAYCGIEFLIP